MTTYPSTRALFLAALMSGAVWNAAHSQGLSIGKPDNKGFFQKKQADSIKAHYALAGYTVLEETRVNMKSETDLPVIVTMKEGAWYQVVFIGDTRSRTFEVRMYDYDENEVVYKQNKNRKDGNIITYSYVPRGSEFHLIKPLQTTQGKKKNLYGYFILMQKTAAPETASAYRP
jgi:hypothetical protein